MAGKERPGGKPTLPQLPASAHWRKSELLDWIFRHKPHVTIRKSMKIPDLVAIINGPDKTAKVESPENVPESTGRLVLYIDSLPEHGEYQDLATLVEPLKAKVCEINRISYYNEMDYAKGPRQVAGLLTKMKITGAVVVDSTDPVAKECLPVLRVMADTIIRGF